MKLLDDLHLIEGTPGGNVYLIESETITLIDAGWRSSAEGIAAYVRSIGRNLDDIQNVILTHGHPDHCSGVEHLRRRTSFRVWAHGATTRAGTDGTRRIRYLRLPMIPTVVVDRIVSDGDKLPFVEGLYVVHTPGHTNGSICLYWEDRKALFSGDTLLSGDGRYFGRSIWYPGSNTRLHRESLKRLLQLDLDAVYVGHGVPVTSNVVSRLHTFSDVYYGDSKPLWWLAMMNLPALTHWGARRLARNYK